MSNSRRLLIAAFTLAVAAMFLKSGTVSASEYGASTYRVGFMDMMAGALPPPGTTIAKSYFLYQDADTDASNRQIALHADTVSYTEAALALHVTSLKLLGANYAFGGIAQTHLLQQSLGVGPVGFSVPRKNLTFGGLGDTVLLPSILSWHLNNFHFQSLLAVYVPTGAYDSKRIVNTGLNRWALEKDFGFTWLDEDSGREVSAFTGYTINFRNSATDYRSGDEFHIDYAAVQHLPHAIVAGVTGYAFQQVTPDTGSGAVFGGFRGRVLALGPLTGKTFDVLGQKVDVTFKYDFEFAAQNRGTGNECWFNAAVAL